MNATSTSFEAIQEFVCQHERVIVRGAGTKTGLAPSPSGVSRDWERVGVRGRPSLEGGSVNGNAPQPQVPSPGSQARHPLPVAASPLGEGVCILDTTGLTGITEYDPGEFTFTALAGTPLRQIVATLAEHGQYLPFDPPLVEAGATLGGTVATGLSGPGRLRYGGVRDFIIGVRFVDGLGKLIHGGGKVVKNAAGFDLPKLMVGSLGQLGVLVELTFKVFPRPFAATTLRIEAPGLVGALETMVRLAGAPLDLDALEIEPPGTVIVRLAGRPEAMAGRARDVEACVGKTVAVLPGDESRTYWQNVDEFEWVGSGSLVKVPTTPGRIAALDERLERNGAVRRYSVAGNVAWVGWPVDRPMDALGQLLTELKLAGLVVLRRSNAIGSRVRLGVDPERPFAQRVKKALDPAGKFAE